MLIECCDDDDGNGGFLEPLQRNKVKLSFQGQEPYIFWWYFLKLLAEPLVPCNHSINNRVNGDGLEVHYLESQNRLCIDCLSQGLPVCLPLIIHWQETDRACEFSVISFVLFLDPSDQSLGLSPSDPLPWAAGPGHSELQFIFKLNWNGPRDSSLNPRGEVSTVTQQTTFIFLWQSSHWQGPSVTLRQVSCKCSLLFLNASDV